MVITIAPSSPFQKDRHFFPQLHTGWTEGGSYLTKKSFEKKIITMYCLFYVPRLLRAQFVKCYGGDLLKLNSLLNKNYWALDPYSDSLPLTVVFLFPQRPF
jgi:hypothetical protein